MWIFLLLSLTACGQAPVRDSVTPTPEVRSQTSTEASAREEPQRLRVVQTARSMLGTPYRYGGTNPAGFDCSGLVWFSHQRAGIVVPRTASQQHRSARQRVRKGALAPGDLVFFTTRRGGSYHVGIYVGDGRFIHAPSSGGRVATASMESDYWRERFLGAANFY